MRRAGERLRITAQLIRASDGFHLWSDTYERSGEDSFGVQGEIAEKIAAALDVVLDDEQLARMRTSGLRNPEAFIAYQKGLELMARAHEGDRADVTTKLSAANKFFERTVELVEMYGAEPRAAHFAMLGDRERASQLAAIQDAAPLGFLNLLNEIGTCSCGAPFDLEVTPNFARLIEEGDFSWPPPAPIDWPLKDW